MDPGDYMESLFCQDSDDEDDRDAEIERQTKAYMEKLNQFREREQSGYNDKLLELVQSMTHQERASMAIRSSESMLFGLSSRPSSPFVRIKKFDELAEFCRAFQFGWKLLPDCWVGMCSMLDFIAEKFVPEDIQRLDSQTLEVVKEIATTTVWPNNPFCGHVLSSAAKTILARHSRSASFEEATAIDMIRRMALLDRSIVSSGPIQPARSNGKGDQRRICNSPSCTKVEDSAAKFPVCGRCKKVSYCSKECQANHWKQGHKAQCFHVK